VQLGAVCPATCYDGSGACRRGPPAAASACLDGECDQDDGRLALLDDAALPFHLAAGRDRLAGLHYGSAALRQAVSHVYHPAGLGFRV
jgi:hypothetical protein